MRFCLFVYVEHLLGWESAYLSDDLRIEKEGIYSKYREYKTNNCHKRDFHLAKDASKVDFLSKSDYLFSEFGVLLEPLLGWECTLVCHDSRTKKKGLR